MHLIQQKVLTDFEGFPKLFPAPDTKAFSGLPFRLRHPPAFSRGSSRLSLRLDGLRPGGL